MTDELKPGDRILVVQAPHGAWGANNRTGIVIPAPTRPDPRLLSGVDTPDSVWVALEDEKIYGKIWAIGRPGEFTYTRLGGRVEAPPGYTGHVGFPPKVETALAALRGKVYSDRSVPADLGNAMIRLTSYLDEEDLPVVAVNAADLRLVLKALAEKQKAD